MAPEVRDTFRGLDLAAWYGAAYSEFRMQLEGREVEYDGDPPWPSTIRGPGTHAHQSASGEWSVEQTPRRVIQWRRAAIFCAGMQQVVEVRWEPTDDGANRFVSAHRLDPEDRAESGPQAKFLRRALRLIAQLKKVGAPRGPRPKMDDLEAAAIDAAGRLRQKGITRARGPL